MSIGFFKSKKSISGWEDSYFGGYYGVLRDYPEIKVNKDIDFDQISFSKAELSYYMHSKLSKLFLLKVNEHNLGKEFTENANTDNNVKHNLSGEPYVEFKTVEKSISNCIEQIIKSDIELGNLFKNYKNELLNTEFTYRESVKPEDQQQQQGGGQGQGQESEDQDGQGQDGDGDSEDENENSGEGDGKSQGNGREQDTSSGKSKDGDGDGDKQGDDKQGKDSKKESDKAESDGDNSSQSKKKMSQKTVVYKNSSRGIQNFSKAVGETKKIEYMLTNWSNNISGDHKKRTVWHPLSPYPSGTKYTADMKFYAGQLANMLDINFASASDRVNSLKTGKMDANKLAESLCGNMNIYYNIQENQTTRPFSVCILGDESGSMQGYKVEQQKDLIKILYACFLQVMPPDKIFIYGHTGDIDRHHVSGASSYGPTMRLYNDRYNHTFDTLIDNMGKTRMGNNYDGPAIENVYEKVRSQTQDNIIFISISDGAPHGNGYGGMSAINEMKRIIEKCKRDGFVTVGIGIQDSTVTHIYNYNTVVRELGPDMIRKVSMLINQVVKTEFQE